MKEWQSNIPPFVKVPSLSLGQTRVRGFLGDNDYKKEEFYDFLLKLIQKIIYNDPTKNSIFKWRKSDYIWLPKNKSLFFAKPNSWLPIWNLTSQLFSNIYLSDFDKFVKNEVWCRYYWRYVDDFIVIHKDKEFLISLIQKIKIYLQDNLWLTLHPNKIYLQHYTKWVLFLWAFIKPHRNYIRKRTIWYFYAKVQKLNERLKIFCHYSDWLDNLEKNDTQFYRSPDHTTPGTGIREWQSIKQDFLSIINSYLGMMKHYKTYKVRIKILNYKVLAYFWNEFYVSSWYSKIVSKRKF